MDKEHELISAAMYWGVGDAEDDEESVIKNQLILTSWDCELYLFDDDDAESRTGEQRSQPTGRHKMPINFLDFKMVTPINASHGRANQGLIATASDDGQIVVYN